MIITDICAFGTSLTAGSADGSGGFWGPWLCEALTPGKSSRVRAYNEGGGGLDSNDALSRISRVTNYRPKIVTIEYLMNDCATAASISVAQSETNHTTIIADIRTALPDVLIFLMTMNPPIGAAVAARPNIEDYNDMYRALAVTLDVGLIDIAPDWTGAGGVMIPDGIHPTEAATKQIAVPAIAAGLSASIP